jgi:hypothetical protein
LLVRLRGGHVRWAAELDMRAAGFDEIYRNDDELPSF